METKHIESIESFYKLKKEWEKLIELNYNYTIFQTWLWHYTWWKNFGAQGELQIVTALDKNSLKGIAPLCFQESQTKTIQFIGGMDLTDYMDFIIAPGAEKHFFDALALHFVQQQKKWDQIQLHFVPETSPSLKYLKPAFQKQGLTVEIENEEVCPFVELPSSWQVYLQRLNKKNRHELKRKINKIIRETNAHMTIIKKGDVTEVINSFIRLHKLSSSDKASFMDTKKRVFFNEIARSFSACALLELPLLVTDSHPIASLYCFLYHNKAYIYNSGYDPTYSRWSPGIVVIILYIEELIKRGVKSIDFLRGAESYKYSFGTQNHQLYKITVT